MNRKVFVFFCLLLTVLLLTVSVIAAQQAKKVYRIGVLAPGSPSVTKPLHRAFLQGLRELGYIEGQNILVEYRYAAGKSDRLYDLANEFLASEFKRHRSERGKCSLFATPM